MENINEYALDVISFYKGRNMRMFTYETLEKMKNKAIKNILSDKQEAAILINEVLELEGREKIKPSEITEYKTDFITKDYFNREIDIIYKDLTQKNVFYLIEHQSKVDYRMPMRLIEYYNEVMKNTYKNRELNKNMICQ